MTTFWRGEDDDAAVKAVAASAWVSSDLDFLSYTSTAFPAR
jgi:hypothetical protein